MIQPSGIDVDQTVDLVAVDIRGEVLEPGRHRADAASTSRSPSAAASSPKTLPVNPVVTGTPATGFEVESVTVSPPVVLVEGDADALAALAAVDTDPVSISGASTDLSRSVPLDLPDGVDAVSGGTVTVTITFQPVAATRTYTAGIVLSGARDDRTYTLSTGSVLVTVGGTVAALDALDPRSLAVVADVDGLGPGTPQGQAEGLAAGRRQARRDEPARGHRDRRRERPPPPSSSPAPSPSGP